MSSKKSLSFTVKKSLLVGAVGATSLAALSGCDDNVIVNPAPENFASADAGAGDDAGDAGTDAADDVEDGDVDGDGDADGDG